MVNKFIFFGKLNFICLEFYWCWTKSKWIWQSTIWSSANATDTTNKRWY